MLRSLLLVGPDKQRILLDGQMRRVQRVGVRLSVTPMVIRVALSATAGESEKCEIDGSAYMALRDIVNYYSELTCIAACRGLSPVGRV